MNKSYAPYHDEVLRALEEAAEPERAAAIKEDRRTDLEVLAVRAPALKRIVKRGFSFYAEPEARVLAVWDALWSASPYFEVLSAALEFYGVRAKKRVDPQWWPVLKRWSARVENWAHADGLAVLYSRLLESDPEAVYGQIERWNADSDQWLRRVSLVSLIHYTGKNAVFLPLDKVLPLTDACLEDERYYVQKAVGWVLREMGHVYPDEIRQYLEQNMAALSSVAFSRAIERRDPAERRQLRGLRRDQGA